jgi:hypothetical protein
MRCRIRLSACVPYALLALPACSGRESFALPPVAIIGTPSTRYEAACTAWASSNCDYEQRCDVGGFLQWSDRDQCVARSTLTCELMAEDPEVSFDEARVQGCQLPSDCAAPVPVCWPPGGARLGQPCVWNEACRSGICFHPPDVGICGVCVCELQCGPGQACQLDSAGGRCIDLPHAPGEPCTASRDCESRQCPSAAAGSSMCSPFAMLGDPCGGNGMPQCQPDLTCDPGTSQCNTTAYVGFNASCEMDGGPVLGCRGFASCTGGVCVPPAGDGEPCTGDFQCAPPAECIANRCVFPSPADCPL